MSITMNEENVGGNATREQAERMIELLRARGYDMTYGPSDDAMDDNGETALSAINDGVWQAALDAI